jgi:hypothetical protein
MVRALDAIRSFLPASSHSMYLPGPKTAEKCVKRAVRTHKNAIESTFTVGNAKGGLTTPEGPDMCAKCTVKSTEKPMTMTAAMDSATPRLQSR